MNALASIRGEFFAALRPPRKLALSEWLESNVRLPSTVAAQPGRIRLWPHQKMIADSIGDPAVERVSVLKSARVGYSQLLVGAIGHFALNDPAPVLCVLPADADCRHMMTASIEPTFAASPALRDALTEDSTGRDTMLSRAFPGGSLALVSARSPRNLRARTARVLILDEVDGFEASSGDEGDPVSLAIKRTMTYIDRKIVMGSTPVDAETSRICAAYAESDQRVCECQCPSCGDRHEIRWADIHWPEGQPEAAFWACPTCGGVVEESGKAAFVAAGKWRATRPDVKGHHGYRLSALISTLPNAAWGRLAAEFLIAKRSPDTLKPFVNTVLGEAWRDDSEGLDDADLISRVEPINLDSIPHEVLALTAGVDVQGDRLEMVTLGWTADGAALVLAHEIAWGNPLDPTVWIELDDLLLRRFPHPQGGTLTFDAVLIDSGDGGTTDAVYAFCRPRIGRKVFALKGMGGFNRPAVTVSVQKSGIRLQVVGVDAVKAQIIARAPTPMMRYSDSLGADWFGQFTAERIQVRYSRGVPVKQFVRISGRRAEALDCVTYAFAARQVFHLDPERRVADLASAAAPRRAQMVSKSKWLEGS
jgi:phage terminase large subunit GpA-like protein